MADQSINPEDQIFIPSLKNIVKQLLVLFFGAISFFVFVAKKSKFLILGGLICGLLLGYVYYSIKPKFYKVSMIVDFNVLTKKTYAEMIDQLNKLASTGSKQKLARELGISDEVATNILFIDAKNINNVPLRNDTSSKIRQPFKVIVALVKNDLYDSVQTAIINYLNNSPYLKRIKEEERKIYVNKILFIDRELAKLDSLKDEYNRFLSSSKISATFYNNAFNPADIYIQSNNLTNQKETILRAINIDGAAVSVIDGFKGASSSQSISLFKALGLIGGIGLLAGYLVGLLIETRKKVLYH